MSRRFCGPKNRQTASHTDRNSRKPGFSLRLDSPRDCDHHDGPGNPSCGRIPRRSSRPRFDTIRFDGRTEPMRNASRSRSRAIVLRFFRSFRTLILIRDSGGQMHRAVGLVRTAKPPTERASRRHKPAHVRPHVSNLRGVPNIRPALAGRTKFGLSPAHGMRGLNDSVMHRTNHTRSVPPWRLCASSW